MKTTTKKKVTTVKKPAAPMASLDNARTPKGFKNTNEMSANSRAILAMRKGGVGRY